MNGLAVVVACSTIATLIVAAYLIGSAELDDVLGRWRAERDDRAAIAEWERTKRDLDSTFPRVMRP